MYVEIEFYTDIFKENFSQSLRGSLSTVARVTKVGKLPCFCLEFIQRGEGEAMFFGMGFFFADIF